jgi:ribonuclease P protein component
MPPERDTPLTYRKRHRLSKDADYRAVYAEKIKKARGPLLVFVRPNGLPEHRLGLAVGRRAGNAVTRNRIKRLLREAFRHERLALARPDAPPDRQSAYDIIVSVRPHAPMPLPAYRESLVDLVARCHREHERRTRRADPASSPETPGASPKEPEA